MPLKVLHTILLEPQIAIVGLSNWTLDPAKMNRAICLQRPQPSALDIQFTGQRIISKNGQVVESALGRIAEAYHMIYTEQDGRDFIGMRDYYQLIKLLRKDSELNDARKLCIALCRNFGGKPETIDGYNL